MMCQLPPVTVRHGDCSIVRMSLSLPGLRLGIGLLLWLGMGLGGLGLVVAFGWTTEPSDYRHTVERV